ncbi:type II secretion system protein [bacterium]|nr:type II secretion system protein [bacterium]
MNKQAFTVAETLIVLVIIGILGACVLVTIKPNDVRKDMLQKAGVNMVYQIDFATKQVLAKYSLNYQMTKLEALGGAQFSIVDDKADEKLLPLYKRALIPSRNNTIPASYTAMELKNEQGAKISDLKVSSFAQGFNVKNGSYFALKLNKGCTTTETYIYDPSAPEKRGAKNSCGLIFFDVNGPSDPNTIGIDQFIISLSKRGLN